MHSNKFILSYFRNFQKLFSVISAVLLTAHMRTMVSSLKKDVAFCQLERESGPRTRTLGPQGNDKEFGKGKGKVYEVHTCISKIHPLC